MGDDRRSCVLYENKDSTITLLDIPRSIEQAQDFSAVYKHLRLVSASPPASPYPSLEPKSRKAVEALPKPGIQDLLLYRYLDLALQQIRLSFTAPYHLPRSTESANNEQKKRRKRSVDEHTTWQCLDDKHTSHVLIHKNTSFRTELWQASDQFSNYYIPPAATFIQADISPTSISFLAETPTFDLVIMDPPWPNRSARRRGAYETSFGLESMKDLLYSIPLHDKLNSGGFVGVWITNKSSYRDTIIGYGGLFDHWGIQYIEEWIWLKIAESGEPICDIAGLWRKPYETLLVGRRLPHMSSIPPFKRRVVVSVPDLHSRKPNLRQLFLPMLPEKHEALELFARNLTAGWWSCGNEVLQFQQEGFWK